MQFKAFIVALAALAGITTAQTMGFNTDNSAGQCGEDGICTEGGCLLSVNGVAGCTGVTDAFAGYDIHLHHGNKADQSLLPDPAAARLPISVRASAALLTFRYTLIVVL